MSLLLPSRALALASLATLCGTVCGQTIYDDFNGAAVDANRWFQFGPSSLVTMSGGRLRLNGGAANVGFGIFGVDGFRGDFELVLDYDSFATPDPNGDPGFVFHVEDAFGPPFAGAELNLWLQANGTGRDFMAEAYVNSNFINGNQAAASGTSGQLRLARTGNTGIASFRETGQGSWTVLLTVPNLFTSNTVNVDIETVPGSTTAASVNFDQLTYIGTRVTGSPLYGQRCLDLGLTAVSFPVIGNANYSLVAVGGTPFANAPMFLTLGVAQAAVSLTPAGAPGCSLFTTNNVVLAMPRADRFGVTEVSLPIPNAGNLVGATLYFQALGATGQNALGVAASNGVRCVITR